MIDEYLRKHPNLPIETHVGRTPEIIQLAHACVAVSGSVTLELLYRLKPTAIVYRIGRLDLRVCRMFMKSRYITLVNLLGEKELFPEYLTDRCEANNIAAHVLRWLNDADAFRATCEGLAVLREQVGNPGACAQSGELHCGGIGQERETPAFCGTGFLIKARVLARQGRETRASSRVLKGYSEVFSSVICRAEPKTADTQSSQDVSRKISNVPQNMAKLADRRDGHSSARPGWLQKLVRSAEAAGRSAVSQSDAHRGEGRGLSSEARAVL